MTDVEWFEGLCYRISWSVLIFSAGVVLTLFVVGISQL